VSKHLWLIRVFVRGKILSALLPLLLPAGTALAGDKEPFAVLELGAAGEWGLNGDGSSFGPTAAIEFTAIKNWLAIEPGVTTLFSRGQTEWDTGFVFRKPFDLSPAVEFEPGIGPVWIHTVGNGRTTDSIGVDASAHFEIWPTPDRKYGWFLEPGYTYSFGSGHEQSFGVSAGLLIPIE
jgi:hypothetical protein